MKLIANFSLESMEARRQVGSHIKSGKIKTTVNQGFYIWQNYNLKNEEVIKTFPDK